jgi:GR25 family glycosyltransferase involved in LPS biosynthesis
MTHTNLLLDQISRDYETALVFEDDVIITDEVFAMHQDGECL